MTRERWPVARDPRTCMPRMEILPLLHHEEGCVAKTFLYVFTLLLCISRQKIQALISASALFGTTLARVKILFTFSATPQYSVEIQREFFTCLDIPSSSYSKTNIFHRQNRASIHHHRVVAHNVWITRERRQPAIDNMQKKAEITGTEVSQ